MIQEVLEFVVFISLLVVVLLQNAEIKDLEKQVIKDQVK